MRATALDRDAAQQCGVDVNLVNSAVFAIAAALGGVSGLLVGMYYNNIDPNMGYQAGLKGIVAQMIGGMGNVPGAIAGSLLLGLIESYGIAAFGTSYRNLFAFVVMILILVLKPNGIFAERAKPSARAADGHFHRAERPSPLAMACRVRRHCRRAPRCLSSCITATVLQTLGISWLYARSGDQPDPRCRNGGADFAWARRLARDRCLRVGTAGDAVRASGSQFAFCWPVSSPRARYAAALPVVSAARPLRDHRHAGSWRDRDARYLELGQPYARSRRPLGDSAAIGVRRQGRQRSVDLRDRARCVASRGRAPVPTAQLASRDVRCGRSATTTWPHACYGIALDRYKALAFGMAGLSAGVAGGVLAHVYSYINHETFTSQVSLLALTMVILGGLGNVAGAVLGSVLLVGLPEVFRVAAEYRMLIYGLALLLLIRFRPQGLLGTQ